MNLYVFHDFLDIHFIIIAPTLERALEYLQEKVQITVTHTDEEYIYFSYVSDGRTIVDYYKYRVCPIQEGIVSLWYTT